MHRGTGFDLSILYSALMPTCMEGVPLLFSFQFPVYISMVPGLLLLLSKCCKQVLLIETYPEVSSHICDTDNFIHCSVVFGSKAGHHLTCVTYFASTVQKSESTIGC